jgi:hypothetical protein
MGTVVFEVPAQTVMFLCIMTGMLLGILLDRLFVWGDTPDKEVKK